MRRNLIHARRLLGDAVGENIWLVHGDATQLDLPDASFDGYWSVQVLQHIPNVAAAIKEANRVLKSGGVFANYSLNHARAVAWLYRLLGRTYVVDGDVRDTFFLRRADDRTRHLVRALFGSPVSIRYSEVLFKPEFGLSRLGREGSALGRIDSLLGGSSRFWAAVARQESHHVMKR